MDAIFKALNDPARRALLDSLRAKDGQTLTELTEQIEMTRFGVMKHLKVLEDAHLVVTRRQGRFKHHYLNVLPLQEVIDRWIDPFLRPQARSLTRLKAHLERTSPMSKPDFVMSIFIRCTQEALWDALRDPEQAAQYDFLGQRVERRGDALVYSTPDGQETLVTTELEVVPMRRIVTSFEPKWGDTAPSRVVYLIEAEGDYCRLTVEHFDLTHPVVPGEGTADAWARTLNGLKTWLETGKPAQFGGPHLWASA